MNFAAGLRLVKKWVVQIIGVYMIKKQMRL